VEQVLSLPARKTTAVLDIWSGSGGSFDEIFKRVEGVWLRETLTTLNLPGGSRVDHLNTTDQNGRMLRLHLNVANESPPFVAVPG
jgi:hypothetical protein